MENASWVWFALGSAFFAALTAIFGKLGVADMNSQFATLLRTGIIFIGIAVVVTATRAWQPLTAIPRNSLLMIALSAIATGLSWLCYYRALQLGPASRVAPVDKLSVVFVILFAAVFLHETMTWKLAVGGTLITAGALLIILQ